LGGITKGTKESKHPSREFTSRGPKLEELRNMEDSMEKIRAIYGNVSNDCMSGGKHSRNTHVDTMLHITP